MKTRLLFAGLFLWTFAVAAHAAEAPATVATPAEPALESFLTELASPSLAAPEAPAATAKTGCYVSKDCVCGGGYVTIECSGSVSCQVRARSVICDGVTTWGPPIGSCPP